MIDDDDDGVEPQIEDVNNYYFEDGDDNPVCFSILPFQFVEDDKEADFFRKDVFLHGVARTSPHVFKKVVAWKMSLDSEQPNISVLSIEHKWIKLLKPRTCYYEDSVRSILITVQMLHFVRRGGQRISLTHLWDHLDKVFGKYNPKPAAGDLMKHHTLIKLFVEKDQTLKKSKILQRLIKNGFEGTEKRGNSIRPFVPRRAAARAGAQGRQALGHPLKDGDGSTDDGDASSDDDDDSSDDDDDDSSDDDGTDQICAICDDGGDLLICEGPCKRSFHATEEDGRESKCETLGYTSAEVKGIDTYLCANCKNKQHQCFICGELEPSHGPNAKVFQCNWASCGYFYHPKCIALLLDPNATDGACGLERSIMAGMSFPCPIHWCSKCGRMENKKQKKLRFTVCTRCPRAYHRHKECLPRELTLGAKDKDGNQRAWKLNKKYFIYCLDHEIDKDTHTASRNHIKFPTTPECTKTKELGNSKGRMTGKRTKSTDQSTKPTKTKELGNSKGRMPGKRRKSTDQSTKLTESPNRLCRAENGQADNVGAKSTTPQIVVEPHCLKGDPRIEQSFIGVADQSTKPTESSNRLCGAESEQADTVGVKSISPQIVVEPHCAAELLKDDPQIEQSFIGIADQSTKPTELSNRFCGPESDQADNVGAKSTSPQIAVEPHCATKLLKGDPQIEQSIIGVAASKNGADEKQFGSSCVAITETEKRVTCLAGIPYDGPSTKGMSDCSVQDTPVDKDVELDNVACRIIDDKYTNGREKTQEDYTRKETAHHKDSSENQGQKDVLELDNLWVEIQANGSPLEPGNKRDKEWQENTYGLGSASLQEKETSSKRKNPRSDKGMVLTNDSKVIDYRKCGTTVDNVGDHSSEGSYSRQGEQSHSKCNDGLVAIDKDTSSGTSKKRSQPMEKASDGKKTDLDKKKKHNLGERSRSKCNDGLVAIDQDTSGDRSKKRSQPVEKASDGNKTDLDKNKQHNLREDGRNAHCEDMRTERNTAADTSRQKCSDKTQSDRIEEEEPVERNTRTRSMEHSLEGQRMDRGDSYPGTCNGQRSESPHGVNSTRSGGDDRRQLSPCQSSFPLPEFGGDHSHLVVTNGRHNPPYRLAGGYGERSRASRPVTERYAPHLDRTNYQPRSHLQASWPVTDMYAAHLGHTNYQPSQSALQYDPWHLPAPALHNRMQCDPWHLPAPALHNRMQCDPWYLQPYY